MPKDTLVTVTIHFDSALDSLETVARSVHAAGNTIAMTKALASEHRLMVAPRFGDDDWPTATVTVEDYPQKPVPF